MIRTDIRNTGGIFPNILCVVFLIEALLDFWPGPIQNWLYDHRRRQRLEILDCVGRGIIYLPGETKALISCAVTTHLICPFVFEYAK